MAIAVILTIINRQILLISQINKTVSTLGLFFLVSFDGFFNLQQKDGLFIKQLSKIMFIFILKS